LAKTADWYRAWFQNGEIISHQQLAEYVNYAVRANVEWTKP
jgi:hypothetical protein